jgi:hypothetical protein
MAVLDRVVRRHLDFDGDLYGDERERLRWYEGIATAASLQWLAIPWVAAILVVFFLGAVYAFHPESSVWKSTALGALFGAALAGVSAVVGTRRKRRLEARATVDED